MGLIFFRPTPLMISGVLSAANTCQDSYENRVNATDVDFDWFRNSG